MYKAVIRPILFKFNPETVHNFTFAYLKLAKHIPGLKWYMKKKFTIKDTKFEKEVFGIKFPNPIGLAAGLDKNAVAYDMLGYMGFGFVEVGTVTPKPQPGNPKPRLFRLPKNHAIINRMGFNNRGVEAMAKRLKKKRSKIIIGGNIGKNKITPNDEAINDYVAAFKALYDCVDYFVVNVSSPNTPNLRELQDKKPLLAILMALQQENSYLGKKKPILLKIAPDLTESQLDDIVEIVMESKIDGVVATNTTIDRNGLSNYDQSTIDNFGAGGLSGEPVKNKSTEVIKYLHAKSHGSFPIIGVGGIFSAKDAQEKLDAGASLVQVYSGFIYEGPAMVKRILRGLQM